MISSITAIHVARRNLGLDEDTYRAKLHAVTGKFSIKEMTEAERLQVLFAMRGNDFKPGTIRANGHRKLSGRYAQKLQALWIAGWNLGVFRDRGDAALETFVKRQTGLDRERFLHHADDAAKVIEALKAWIAREGGVVWADRRSMQPWQRQHGYKIARAQWAMIDPEEAGRFWPAVTDLVGESAISRQMTDAQWILVMNHFGERIRAGTQTP